MVGKLRLAISMTPVIPLPGHGRDLLYFTHQEDLCRVAEEYCAGIDTEDGTVITAANPSPWMFRDILKEMGRRQNRRILCIPTPRSLSWIALKIPELLGVSMPFKSDSLISLLNQDPSPHFISRLSGAFRAF